MSSPPVPPTAVEPDFDPDPVRIDASIGDWQGNPDVLAMCGEHVPLIDRQALDEFGEDFDSPTAAQNFVKNFVRDFSQSWEGKYQRLAASVHDRDQPRAKEAVLSVKVTSIMVGAKRLAQLAAYTEQLVDSNDMDAAARMLTCVEACGSETRTALLETHIR